MALMKILYLSTVDVTKKWFERMMEWTIIYSQLDIYFGERTVTKSVTVPEIFKLSSFLFEFF